MERISKAAWKRVLKAHGWDVDKTRASKEHCTIWIPSATDYDSSARIAFSCLVQDSPVYSDIETALLEELHAARVSLGETEAGAPEITSDAFASAAETTPPVTAPAPTDDAESVRVERVAKALYEARRDDWNVSWEELGESPREKCLAAASVLVRLANGEL